MTHFTFLLSALSMQNPADTLPPLDLPPIQIIATRFEQVSAEAPYAITVLGKDRLQNGTQQLSLTESLSAIPGVFALNPDNFAQDLRLSVRGFGARSAFGIRGIRLLVDGLPESTPDGQADVDNLDLSLLQRAELLRGASSGLYGNAAGGVLNFQTEEPGGKNTFGAQMGFGSYGFQKYAAKAGFTTGKLGVFLAATHNRLEGYREHARMEQSICSAKLRYHLPSSTRLSLLINAGFSPVAEDAGGLTAAQVTENRRQARPQNIQFDAGEALNSEKIGGILEKKWGRKHLMKAHAFTAFRQFSSRLPFQSGAAVDFDRRFGGLGLLYVYSGNGWRSQLGVEAQQQRDARERFDNLNGQKGMMTLNQVERFKNQALFGLTEIVLAKPLILTLGARLDDIEMLLSDHFLSDGDQGDQRHFTRLNPTMGLNWRISSKITAYTNLNSSFETPTLNELSANPTGAGGFNSALKPQYAQSGELGLKAQWSQRISAELAYYHIQLKQEFVPYQLLPQPGRTFYRNAGESLRDGLECSGQAKILHNLTLFLTYTYSDFSYRRYESNGIRYDGNRQPGIPQYIAFAELSWTHPKKVFALAQAQYASACFLDDANQVREPARTLLNLRLGYRWEKDASKIDLFLGINNALSTVYNGNLLLNASGGRYFEPSAGANGFLGLRYTYKK